MPLIALNLLDADSRNANVCDSDTLNKIAKNIQQTGFCPSLIVRLHPQHPERYMLLDGHHRKLVLEKLGWQAVECQIWDISDQNAQLALSTLNRLRGTDNLQKRAELIHGLTQWIEPAELATLIPENTTEIQDLLSLLDLSFTEMETKLKEQIEQEEANLPVPFGCMLPADKVSMVEEALALMKQPDKGIALIALCQEALDAKTGQ